MRDLYLSLGSNQGNRIDNLRQAVKNIEEQIGELVASSSYYETEPWGFTDNTNFINQVIKVKSRLTADEILAISQKIEKDLGRKRLKTNQEYSSRNIDIDILFLGDIVLNDLHLTVPHKHLHKRNFVLQPMFEISPDFVHPVLKKTIQQLIKECNDDKQILKL